MSIRAVASRCSVSAGTIYNYYESKADLLGDTIESIWREIFFHSEDEQVFKDVAACISLIYKRLEYGNEKDWNMEMSNSRASFLCIRLDL